MNVTLDILLASVGAGFCIILAVYALIKDSRSFVNRVFVFGILCLFLESTFIGLVTLSTSPAMQIFWHKLRLMTTALLPGFWLPFSLSLAGSDRKEISAKWKWGIVAAFSIPLIITFFFHNVFFSGLYLVESSTGLVYRLGWAGSILHIFFLIGIIPVLINFEKTFRASVGRTRWQIKFMLIGLGGIFFIHIYICSQILLFSLVNLQWWRLNSLALAIAGILIAVSINRSSPSKTHIYLSQTSIFNSITLLLVGVYLLIVGGMSKFVSRLGGSPYAWLNGLFVLLAILALVLLLFSDRVRLRMKRFISRHFNQPVYDYRAVWDSFSQKTASILDIAGLAAAVVKIVSQTFDILSVSIWVLDEKNERLEIGSSTFLDLTKGENLKRASVKELMNQMQIHSLAVIDLEEMDWARKQKEADIEFYTKTRIRYVVPLIVHDQIVGLMTLDDRVSREPLNIEDLDLLKTMADHTAANLLNIRLTEQLAKAKELELFQLLSAFFIHDLKNLATTLSMTMQNLPVHFENPVFRADALKTISQSVVKINHMCERLSLLKEKAEFEMVETDLSELILTTLAALNGTICVLFDKPPQALPKIMIDPVQIQKVLLNLILNANDAVADLGPSGKIHVAIAQRTEIIELIVCDTGCGMSQDFIETSLFQPFKTTKKKGLGIGLHQCKMIVEAHQGKIHVKSQEGKGTTFRISLPIKN